MFNTIGEKKTVLRLIFKAPLSLPASFFCKKAKHGVPSFLFHTCTSVPTWFISERMARHVTFLHLFTATSLSLLGLRVGAQAGFTRGQCPGPCAALPSSFCPGHPAFWGLCYRLTLVPPTSHLSTTPLTHPNPPTCSPEKAAFSAWYGNRNGLWPTGSSALYLELLKTPNSVFTTNMPCRCPTSSAISILYHFPREPPPSMLMTCFVILENVNKPVRLSFFFFFFF